MTTHKNLMTLCVAALFTLGLAACGGNGGDGPTTTTPMPGGSPLAFSALEGGMEVLAGHYHLTDAPADFVAALGAVEQPQGGYAPGSMVTVGGLDLHCADAGAGNCSVAVNDDGSFTVMGTILVVAAGEMPPMATLPTPPTPPTPVDVDLSGVTMGYEVTAATLEIAAGATMTHGDVDFMCAAGGDACMVMVMADGTATSTGGMVTAMDSAGYTQSQQRMAISTAIADAQKAVNAVNNDSTDAEVETATQAIADARTAIAEASNVPQGEKDANTGTVDAIMGQLSTAMAARTEHRNAQIAAMAVTAAKLYNGIGMTPLASTGDGARTAAYGTGDNVDDIVLTIDDAAPGDGTDTTVTLTEDEDTTVAANHGWQGKRYTRTTPASEGTYEAIVYSNVEEPTEGNKFNSGTTGDNAVGFATTDGVLTLAAATNVATRIASPSFDHTVGSKTFHLPEDNPQGETMIVIPGSYYGVAGRYSCTPGTAADGCSVTRAENGYTLDVTTDTWTFKATNPDARVMDAEDTVYASYGWWLHKAANDGAFTASAFVAEKGDVDAAALAIADLNGTATYRGGAAGKYALSSSTGGTNDAGHFTARAMLEANFNTEMISGTIDNFMGADDQPRNWSVELERSGFSTEGVILGADGTGDPMETEWTIDDTAAAAAGQWSGNFRNVDADTGVPQVATGTFYSTYGTAGRMVGAFGANKQ